MSKIIINYEQLKEYLSKHKSEENIDNPINPIYDNDSRLLILLCHNHPDTFDSLVIKYLPNNQNLDSIKKMMKNHYSYIYYRFYYFFYILVKYVYSYIESSNIKYIFENFIRYTRKVNYHSNMELYDNIVEQFIKNFDYLYDVFFVKDNIYFNVYFNNLIKYFLPLPHEYLLYCQFITYRNNVKTFYKKNNDDPIEITSKAERVKMVGDKNIDTIKNEIDIHIPLKHFNTNIKNNTNYVYLIAYKSENQYKLLIAGNIKVNNTFEINNIHYERNVRFFDQNKYNRGYPLQSMFEKWQTTTNNITIDISNVVYVSVMRKITSDDLFNVFLPMNLSTEYYTYLFHNMGYPTTKDNINHVLSNPSFFYFIPHGTETLLGSYFKNRKCCIFKLKKSIDNILDLTQSIITNNPFTDNEQIKEKHSKQSLWKGYDLNQIMNYYENKEIPFVVNHNYKCVTVDKNTNIDNFVGDRPYCDIGTKKSYVGRRKLYEILLKTRKYDTSAIWPMEYLIDTYRKFKIDINKSEFNDPLYNSPDKIKSNAASYLYDAVLLKTLGYNGFFFTDYQVAFAYGGELMLTNPKDYIEMYKCSSQTCDKKIEFNQTRLQQEKSPYAYVALLMGDSPYFLGALIFGYSLRTVSQYDVVIMVTPDVPAKQKEILKEYYIVIEIDFVQVDKALIKDYDTNRFRDVFTKLQCFKLTQYQKIIMIDIDMLVIKNMDHLFDLPAPAASLRRIDLPQGKPIPKSLIVKNGKLVGGINAGLMLLEPNIDEYNDMLNDIKKAKNRQFKFIEQDYLSQRYADKWTNISFIYNFQFGLTDRAKKYDPNDIYNLHYSSRLKPWKIIYKPEETWKWINEEQQTVPYYKLWMNTYDQLNKIYLSKNIDINKLYKLPSSSSSEISVKEDSN